MPESTTLTERLSNLIDKWQTRENELIDWLTGRADGGPEGNGKYPLSTRNGDVKHVMCPAAVADMVTGPAADAKSHAADASQNADRAEDRASMAVDARAESEAAKSASETARMRAERARDVAESQASNAKSRVTKHFPSTQTVKIPTQISPATLQNEDPGTIGWDDYNLYIKTTNDVKRIPLEKV